MAPSVSDVRMVFVASSGNAKNHAGKRALYKNDMMANAQINIKFTDGLEENISAVYLDHGANRDVFSGSSKVLGPLAMKLHPLTVCKSNQNEWDLCAGGMGDFCVPLLWTGSIVIEGTHYSALLQILGQSVCDIIRDICHTGELSKLKSRKIIDICYDILSLFLDTAASGHSFKDAGLHNLGFCPGVGNNIFLDFEHSKKGAIARKMWNLSVRRIFSAMVAHMASNASWDDLGTSLFAMA
jgi:hypothetical protein